MAARIVFQSRRRGIPSLRRGWRTPDPSPSRDLDEIPAPIMTIIEVESKQGDDDATQGEKTSTWDCATMRAPSQSPEKWDACGQDEVMTPRHGPNTSAWTPVHWQQAIHEPECAPEAGEQTQKIPPYAPGAQVSPLLLSEMLRGSGEELQCTNRVSMGEERFCESFIAATAARTESNMQCSEQQGHALPAYPWSDGHWPTPKRSDYKMKAETNNKNPKPLVSKGSVGHPYSCAEACKYAKKQRGCKDGASCDHCHLCDWKRYQSGRAACRAAAMSKWENQ